MEFHSISLSMLSESFTIGRAVPVTFPERAAPCVTSLCLTPTMGYPAFRNLEQRLVQENRRSNWLLQDNKLKAAFHGC